jgi:hypothetical protein
MFWKKDKYDMKWSVLKDNDVGVLRTDYLELFSDDEFEYFIQEYKKAYRECSQSVHGKYSYMFTVRNTELHYSNDDMLEFLEMEEKVIGLVVSVLLLRYSNNKLNLNETYKAEVVDILKKYKLHNVAEKIKENWK